MYLGRVFKLARQRQRRRSGGNSGKKGARKHKIRNCSKRECKGTVGDIGARLTREVGWCIVVRMLSTLNSLSCLWLQPDLKYHQKQRVNFVRVR